MGNPVGLVKAAGFFLCVYLHDIVNVSRCIRCDEFCSVCGLDNLNRGHMRWRNAAQSDYLTVFMHHECVHYEKK